MNALVKQGNALSTVGYLALPVSVHRRGEMIYKALVTQGVVGAGGVEPPSSSVSANHRGTAVQTAVSAGRVRP